ncbi:hypothetical protein RI129_010604 [Pyrocoelia pectoralis]|uniref:Farnesyl diphosphate synthase n=1 Tax=Pyrocoelia pectoralis TaxID=417401 RepID=A0AAN7V3L9_9COLE
MFLYSKITRRFSSKIATTLATAGKLGKATNIVEQPHDLLGKDTVELLMSQYAFAVRDSLPRTDPELYNAIKRFDDMCYHTGPERELVTNTILLNAYKGFELPENLTPANLKMAAMLGWAFENLVVVTFLSDDIIDNSSVRWKKPSWYTLPNIGLTTLLDMRQVTMGAFALLRKYLKDHPSYKHLHGILSDFQYLMYIGQSLDFIGSSLFKRTRDAHFLSMQRILATTYHKTTATLYLLPILAAAYLAKLDPQIVFKSRSIIKSLGVHRQAQNDMRDLCGDFNNIGKTTGTDIAGGVCTWITGTLFQFGSEEQKNVLLHNYGRPERECQEEVYRVLKEFGIVERYRNYTKEVVAECNEHTSTVAHPGTAKILNLLLEQHVNIDENFYL